MLLTMKQKNSPREDVDDDADDETKEGGEMEVRRAVVHAYVDDDDDETKEGGEMEVRSVVVRARTYRWKQTRTRKDGRQRRAVVHA